MARELDQNELIERWTLIGDNLERVTSTRSAAKLGCALLLKFFAAHGRFPRGRRELPSAVVEFVAKQLRVHQSPDVTSRYLHPDLSALKAAGESFSTW